MSPFINLPHIIFICRQVKLLWNILLCPKLLIVKLLQLFFELKMYNHKRIPLNQQHNGFFSGQPENNSVVHIKEEIEERKVY